MTVKFNVGDVVKFKVSKMGHHWRIVSVDSPGPESTYTIKSVKEGGSYPGISERELMLVKKARVNYWR